jgi:hypothetical protein
MDSFYTIQFYFRLFVFGLPFFMLAYQAAKLQRRPNTSAPWFFLIWFGLGYGLAEWLAIFAPEPTGPTALRLLRSAIMATSLLALLEFGRGQVKIYGRLLPRAWVFLPLILLALTGAIKGSSGLDVTCRYALGIPGGVLSGFALWRMSRSRESAQQYGLQAAAVSLWLAVPLICLVTPMTALPSAGDIQPTGFLSNAQNYIQAILALCALGVWTGLGIYRSNLEAAADRKSMYMLSGVTTLVVLLVAICFTPVDLYNTYLSETGTQGDSTDVMQVALIPQLTDQSEPQANRSWEQIMADRRQMGWNFLKGAMLVVVCMSCICYCCNVCLRVLRHKRRCDISPSLREAK